MSQSKKFLYDTEHTTNKNETLDSCKQKPRGQPKKIGCLWKLLKIEMQIQNDQLAFIYALEKAREEAASKSKHNGKITTKERKRAIVRNNKQGTKNPNKTVEKFLKPKKKHTKAEEKIISEEYTEE